MKASSRVIINTGTQYIRSVLSIIITLYTSRVILENLGVNDFGIYSLVGGVVTMLSFIQNSLSRATQRFLSFHQGRNDIPMVKKVFVNSVISQLFIGTVLCIILLLLTPIIFSHLLNIETQRIGEAKCVYILMVVSLFLNIQSTPYVAALIARENIIFSSIIQITDSLLKIPIAVSLFYIMNQKLIWFSVMTTGINLINYICYYIYSKQKYQECKNFTLKLYNFKLLKDMLSFSFWTTYNTFCIVGRTQGIAILLNRFFTTAINSAYGISNQIIGQLNFLSAAVTTAITPQIIKAEGANDRNKAIRLSEITSKFSLILVSALLIPLYFSLDFLLSKWLKEVPAHTVMFCQYTIIITIIELFTQSLNILNNAIGNIRTYNLIVYSVILLTIPFSWIALKLGYGSSGVMIVYTIDAIACGVTRLIYLHFNIRLSIRQYFCNVIYPCISIIMTNIGFCYIMSKIFIGWNIIFTIIISAIVTIVITYMIGLQPHERKIINNILNKYK